MDGSDEVGARRRSRTVPIIAGAVAASFGAATTVLSWPVSRESVLFAVPVRACGLAGIAIGAVVWAGAPAHRRLGMLILLAGTVYYVQDLRAATNPAVFAAGFWLAYAWTAVCAHIMLSWPTGRLRSRAAGLLTAACYVLSIGSQVVRYAVDRPTPPWGYGVAHPVTAWTTISSLVFAVTAVLVLGWTIGSWFRADPTRRRVAWPVWLVLGTIAVLAAAAAVAAGIDAPVEVQDGLVAVAVAAGVLLIPATGIYGAMQRDLVEIVAANERAVQTEFDTRRQIERDAHDTAQSPLFGALLDLDALEQALYTHDLTVAAARATHARKNLLEIRESLRRLARRIYPATLDEFGLAVAVDSLADQFRPGVTVTVEMPADRRWHPHLERNLYYLISEAITNSVKHASCDRINVSVDETAREVSLRVRDDGRTPIPNGVRPRSLESRVRALGGQFDIQVEPPPGSQVVIRIPKETSARSSR